MKRVSLLMILLCAAMACSCTKEKQAEENSGEEKKEEPQKPQDGTTLFGSYAYDDGSQLTNMFYSFANGNIYEYHLQGGGKVVLAEEALWNTSLDDFSLSKSGAYQVADGSLYINGAMYGSLQMTSDRIIISDRTYSKFRDFKPAWYTTLSVETGDTLKHTYRKQDVNVPIKLDKSVSGSILAATVTQGNAWIINCSIDKGNLVFALAENNTGETRKGGIRVTCPGAEDLSLVVEQSYVSSKITLSIESQNAETQKMLD